MEQLHIRDLHPFVRKVGMAFGLTHGGAMKAYDYRLIFFCTGGRLWLAGEEYSMQAYDAAVIAPGTEYRVALDKSQKIVVINFDLTMEHRLFEDVVLFARTHNFEAEKIIDKQNCACFIPACGYLIKHTNKMVFGLCAKMSRVCLDTEDTEVKQLLLSGQLMEILGELLRSENRKNEKAQKIYQYICEHFQSDITLEHLSETFNYHKTYINRLLKNDYGTSFKQLVIEMRLDQSLLLLEETDMPLAEIASCLGFYDCKHFGHAFKNKFGVNPSEYRK